jgi:hypothetical protein
MTAESAAIDADRIERALQATFGGDVPALVDALVDRAECAKYIDESKIGFVFRLDVDERPRVRLGVEREVARIREGLAGAWAEAGAFVDRFDERYMQAELGADSSGRLFGVNVEEKDGTFHIDGEVVSFPDGAKTSLTTHDTAPVGKVSGALAERLQALADAGAKGQWHLRWDGDTAVAAMWVTERPWTPEAATIIQALGGGERLAATRDVLTEGGHDLDPFLVEIYDDGAMDVCIWGVRRPVEIDSEAKVFFEDGQPNAVAFADRVALTVPVDEQDEARRIAGEALFPAILVARPAGMDVLEHLDKTWSWLVERLADLPPFERLETLGNLTAVTQQAALSRDAFVLAVARYILAHPDAEPPAGVELPEDVMSADAPALAERARSLQEAAAPILEKVRALEAFDLDRIPHVVIVHEELEDTLARVISGDFTAAEGALHEWCMGLGPGGYDDDPSMASLDDIDLEADAAEAAIEEALAMDDDEDW